MPLGCMHVKEAQRLYFRMHKHFNKTGLRSKFLLNNDLTRCRAPNIAPLISPSKTGLANGIFTPKPYAKLLHFLTKITMLIRRSKLFYIRSMSVKGCPNWSWT